MVSKQLVASIAIAADSQNIDDQYSLNQLET